jgi:hypothetical protein
LPVSSKVSAATLAGFLVTAVMLGLSQYAPNIAPKAEFAAAITTLVTALAGYFVPESNIPRQ